MNRSSGSHEEDEALVSFEMAGSASAAHPVRSPESEAGAAVRWVGPGETVEIGGMSVSGGFFYLGHARQSHARSVDACVVDPHMGVADRAANPGAAPPSAAPSYGSLGDEGRRTYLEWLASERTKSGIDTGYLLFHLYGFERRVLIDGAAGKVSTGEFRDMARELRRLLNIDADYVWQRHVRDLLDAIDLMTARGGKMYDQGAPDGMPTGYQVPLNVRVAFGQAALDKEPVPGEWALAWVKLDPMMVRRAAVSRCPEEFGRLFLRKYRERYKAGMILPPGRVVLDARPRPAFTALRHVPVPGFLVGLPDLATSSGPRSKLQLLMNECAAALDSYSRYLGRHPEAQGTLDAALMLPTELWPEATRQGIDALAQEVTQGAQLTTFGRVLGRFGTPGGLTREKAATFCGVLGRAGVGVEPDVRLGARTPRSDDALVLFAVPPDARALPIDATYLAAALSIDLAASVAAAGRAPETGGALIEGRLAGWPRLASAQRTRLRARLRLQLAQPASVTGLKKKLEALPGAAKEDIAGLLVQVAGADGGVAREQVKLLEKIYRMLGIEGRRLYADLHRDGRHEAPAASNAAKQPVARPFALDPSRIAALKTETARVSALLAGVFVEEAHVQPLPQPEPEPVAPSPSQAILPGLDDAHLAFLRLLVQRERWTRSELSAAASALDLMLDGAIEQLNEASLDHWDEPLTDGDDPVDINQDLAQRLAA